MTKVSRRPLSQELKERMFEIFWEAVASLKNPKEAERFFKDLLSPTERLMLVKRLAIAILLTKGYTYDAIDETLKVSRPTIMSVSLWLKHGGEGYKKVIKRILRKEKREEFWDNVEEFLLQIAPAARVGSVRHKGKQEAGRKLYKRQLKRSLL